MREKGIVLITILLIVSAALLLSAGLARILISDYGIINLSVGKAAAFYIAEAGIEKGKCELAANPNFYTDLQFSGNEALWLLNSANGESCPIGGGGFKIVKLKDKEVLYSVGYLGGDMKKSRALSLMKIEYTFPPFRVISWQELK